MTLPYLGQTTEASIFFTLTELPILLTIRILITTMTLPWFYHVQSRELRRQRQLLIGAMGQPLLALEGHNSLLPKEDCCGPKVSAEWTPEIRRERQLKRSPYNR